MPLSKRETKLTYVVILIATTQEKENEEVSFWSFCLLKHSTNSVVLLENFHDRDVRVWNRLCGHKDFH